MFHFELLLIKLQIENYKQIHLNEPSKIQEHLQPFLEMFRSF